MPLDDLALDTLSRAARTHYDRTGAAVADGELRQVFEMAARACCLGAGSMSGLDNGMVGDPAKLHLRLPRLGFDEACRLF